MSGSRPVAVDLHVDVRGAVGAPVAIGASLGELVFIVEPALDEDLSDRTTSEPRAPPLPPRWLRYRASVIGILAGALLALLIGLSRLAVELLRWRRALIVAIPRDRHLPTASTLPYWVPASLPVRSTIASAAEGGTYRAARARDRIGVASPLDARRHALRRLWCIGRALSKKALWLGLPWLLALAAAALSRA